NSGNHGDYSINTGAGSISGAGGNDGAVSYTFAGVADGGVATLNFTTTTPGNLTFDASGTAGISDDDTSGVLDVGACQIRIEHDSNGNVCTAENVTISVRDETGALIPNFTGTVQLSTSSGQGAWANGGGGGGTLVPGGGDGTASYTFSPGDASSAVLSFMHPGVNGSVDIEAVSGAIAEDDQFVGNFNFTACTSGPSQFALQCNDNGNTVSISVPPGGSGS